MTELDFMRGWALLIIQPYASLYNYDSDKEDLQKKLYRTAVTAWATGEWHAVVAWWVEHQDHWPLLGELKVQKQRLFRGEAAPIRYRLTDQSGGGPAPADYLPRLAYEYAKYHEITITDAFHKLAPGWLQANPGHPDYKRVEAFIRQRHETPSPAPRQMPSLQTQDPRAVFATDLASEGRSGVCPVCGASGKVIVCWCRTVEACEACLGAHVGTCRPARRVQEA